MLMSSSVPFNDFDMMKICQWIMKLRLASEKTQLIILY